MLDKKQNIYLIGPMGSGKTTIGNRLARKMGLSFRDSDQEIEARTGANVNLIFDVEGEAGFRDRERRLIEELSAQEGLLVATGGGVILSQANRDLLRRSGFVIYLRTPVKQQLERLRRDHSRPLLHKKNKEYELSELAKLRNPLYEEVANLVFSSRNRNIESTVNQIYRAICTYHDSSATQPREPDIANLEP